MAGASLSHQLAALLQGDVANFADEVGASLRKSFDRTRVKGAPLLQWRKALDEFESLSQERRAHLIAQGARLVRTERGPARATLSSPCTQVKGIGPTFAAALAARGIATIEDLLLLVPRRYDDARAAAQLRDLPDEAHGTRVVVRSTVSASRMIFARGRRWLEVRCEDGPARACIRFFGFRGGAPYAVGTELVWIGKGVKRGAVWEFGNPDVLRAEGIVPHYPAIEGVPAGRLRTALKAACEQLADTIDDGLTPALAVEFGLMALGDALRALHLPAHELTADEVAALNAGHHPAHKRIAFGEMFRQSLLVAARRREWRSQSAPLLPPCVAPAEFPFALTRAQQRVISEIARDLACSTPMNRLLQGDVGAGKTAVLYAAARQAAQHGHQVALMAPTELLAEQHVATFGTWAARDGLRVAKLHAGLPAAVQRTTRALIAAHATDIVIGTHALLSEQLAFACLGLVIVDEQHRFGVAQRVRLRTRTTEQHVPHLLVASATPIPRTLALTAYGDLDLSILDELPPGRVPARTFVVATAAARKRAYEVLCERIARGEQAYVVCARIDETGTSDRRDLETLRAEVAPMLPAGAVAVVHGQQAPAERAPIMERFRQGHISVLIATTMVEVGVDVPRATIMLIEDADVYGLSQLHQLRGRVGRGGGGDAMCFLVTRSSAAESRDRLALLAATNDGLTIAEADLDLRGSGDLLGARQAGAPRVKYGTLQEHIELLKQAKWAADRALDAASSKLPAILQTTGTMAFFGSDGG